MANLEQERILISKCKQDKAVFSQIYSLYYKDVYRYLASLSGSREVAEDLVQETFITAYKKIEQFEWRNVSIKNWLFAIAHKKAFGTFRKQRLEKPMDERYTELNMNEIDTNLEVESDVVEEVSKKLEDLKPIEREILTLKIWEGYAFNEIADLIGKKESSVKMSFYRSLEKLKSSFDADRSLSKYISDSAKVVVVLLLVKNHGLFKPSKVLANLDIINTVNITNSALANFIAKPLITKIAAVGAITIVSSALIAGVVTQVNEDKSESSNKSTSQVVETKDDKKVDLDGEEVVIVEGGVDEAPVDAVVVPTKPVTTPSTPVTPPPAAPILPPAPTNFEYVGTYVSATLPAGWTIVENPVVPDGLTGFAGINIHNTAGTVLFELRPVLATGSGSSICDITEYRRFADDIPGAYDDLLAFKQANCGAGSTITLIELSNNSSFAFSGRSFRRSGSEYYVDDLTGDSYFSAGNANSDPRAEIDASTLGSTLFFQYYSNPVSTIYSVKFSAGADAATLDQVMITLRGL